MAGSLCVHGVRVQRTQVAFEPEAHSFDSVALARRTLTALERKTFASIGEGPRRLEWLVARVAAKVLVLDFFECAEFREVEIVPDERGAPRVCVAGATGACPAPEISISHSGGLVVAALIPGTLGVGLGVDVERVRRRSDAFRCKVTTERERVLMEAWESQHDALTALWCLKEAAIKALGLGLRDLPPWRLEVTSFAADDDATIVLLDAARERHGRARVGRLRGRAVVTGGFALAEVVTAEP